MLSTGGCTHGRPVSGKRGGARPSARCRSSAPQQNLTRASPDAAASTSGRDAGFAQQLPRLRGPTRPHAAGTTQAAWAEAASAAARSTLATVLGAALALSGALASPAPGALAAAPPPPQLSPTAAASPSSAAAAAPPLAALAAPSPSSAAPSAASLQARASAPAPGAIRFTSPGDVDALPPLPTAFPPLPELRLPKYTTATLRNGLRVFLLQDDEVPLVRATLLMRGGQYGSPPDKVGTASLTAYVQRAGGSAAHPAPALDERLEELAAGIELGAGPQALSADMQCLAEDVDEVVALFAEVVRSPALPASTLALYQAQLANALDHQMDSPGAVARRKITKLMYGPDSIYARTPTQAGVASITPADLRAYAERWERPDAAVLGVVGSFRAPEMLALLELHFGDWAPAQGQPPQPPPVPRGAPPALPAEVLAAAAAAPAPASGPAGGGPDGEVAAAALPGSSVPAAVAAVAAVASPPSGPALRPLVYLVDRPNLTQASVLLAEPGVSLSDPDTYALDVLGGVFNSFGGTLFDTLRSREGLAYSVSGSWDSPPDHPGLFVAGGQTSEPGGFLRSLRALLAAAAAEAPAAAELESAKAETLNSFAFNFSSTSTQLQRILVYDLLGLPQDYLFRYFKGIEAVSRADVSRAAAAHLHPGAQAVVVVADSEVARPSLEAAGFRVMPLRLEDAV